MKRILALIFLLMLTVTSVLAATGFSFLEIPVGARESALGGAGVALTTGAVSAVYNPASIGFASHREVALAFNRHFGDTRTEFVGLLFRRGKFTMSPHYWGTRVSDIEYRNQPTSEPISTFDAISSVVGASLAWRPGPRLTLGVTGQYLYQKIHVESSDGAAFDGGVMWQPSVAGLKLAAAVNHLGRVNEFSSERPKLPVTFRGGFGYSRASGKAGSVLLTAEAQAVRDNTPIFHEGLEFRAPGYVALRAGLVQGLDAQTVSFGLGLFIRHFRIDYAFIPFREELGEGHRFSLGFDL